MTDPRMLQNEPMFPDPDPMPDWLNALDSEFDHVLPGGGLQGLLKRLDGARYAEEQRRRDAELAAADAVVLRERAEDRRAVWSVVAVVGWAAAIGFALAWWL